MEKPEGRQPKRGGRKRPGDVDIISLYPDRSNSRAGEPVRRRKPGQSKKRRKARKRRAYLYRTVAVCSIALCLLIAFMAVDLVYDYRKADTAKKAVPVTKEIVSGQDDTEGIKEPEIVEDFLEVNDYSRPGTKLPAVNNIFVHYTANPGTSARQNRSYFASLAETQERSASAHFIIGYEGEIVQCIPLDEQAYAVMTRNEDSISIECCYLENDGEFTKETYDSLVHLLAWLEQEYHLGSDDILRHYDCGGKKCPLYYVEHEDAWEKLLNDVDVYAAGHSSSQL
ncbi:MAG: peptidoglycan recognition protein family protein [Blautia sp.]|nr:peptidoglycan recognition protein family protein [Blautia sp.]